MNEKQLSSQIVREITNIQPEKRKQLFHIANERNSKEQAFEAKAIGIISGVSDFLYFEKNFPLIGMEIKVPESYHKVDHIISQVEWGEVLERQGGVWRLITTVDDAVRMIVGKDFTVGKTTSQMRELIAKNGNKKTIKII